MLFVLANQHCRQRSGCIRFRALVCKRLGRGRLLLFIYDSTTLSLSSMHDLRKQRRTDNKRLFRNSAIKMLKNLHRSFTNRVNFFHSLFDLFRLAEDYRDSHLYLAPTRGTIYRTAAMNIHSRPMISLFAFFLMLFQYASEFEIEWAQVSRERTALASEINDRDRHIHANVFPRLAFFLLRRSTSSHRPRSHTT